MVNCDVTSVVDCVGRTQDCVEIVCGRLVDSVLSGNKTEGWRLAALQISLPLNLIDWSFGALFRTLYCTKIRTSKGGPGLILI